MMPSTSEKQRKFSLDYWAGLFDGEGCVYVSLCQKKGTSRPQASLKVSLGNTHRGVVEALALDFPPPSGRAVASYLGGPKDQIHRRQQWKWEMSGMAAYQFLRLVAPFLIIKAEQAMLAMEFYEQPWRTKRVGRGGGWKIRTDANVLVDIDYARRLKALKHAL